MFVRAQHQHWRDWLLQLQGRSDLLTQSCMWSCLSYILWYCKEPTNDSSIWRPLYEKTESLKPYYVQNNEAEDAITHSYLRIVGTAYTCNDTFLKHSQLKRQSFLECTMLTRREGPGQQDKYKSYFFASLLVWGCYLSLLVNKWLYQDWQDCSWAQVFLKTSV